MPSTTTTNGQPGPFPDEAEVPGNGIRAAQDAFVVGAAGSLGLLS
jgi:hypothetical protein